MFFDFTARVPSKLDCYSLGIRPTSGGIQVSRQRRVFSPQGFCSFSHGCDHFDWILHPLLLGQLGANEIWVHIDDLTSPKKATDPITFGEKPFSSRIFGRTWR